MEDELKISKQYFTRISELAYQIGSDELDETIASIELEIKKVKDPQEIRNAIDEILVLLGDIPYDSDSQEIINQINTLLVELDEEFL